MNQTMSASPTHIPVLLEETIEALAILPGGRYIDCTLGAGGHANAILERSLPGGQLLGIDADPEAIAVARARLEAHKRTTLLINDNFANLRAIATRCDFFPVHGILFDLGLSSLQLESSGRGFSFNRDEPLDMRLSPRQEVTAADIVNTSPEMELARLIKTLGEERYSRRIAHHIVKERPIKTTLELAGVIERAVGGRRGRIHPATRTFQALRIAVNHELEHLESALEQATGLLGLGGRLVVISYHSLDDRIVKRFMREEAGKENLRLVYKKVITPSLAEVHFNPRSRSAKLRAAERITIPEAGGG
jgi:16S rRNA (cytosine1402-N4)-methyltransferase